MPEKTKKFETIACCGIDCGLCPRFYTKGTSTCSGCGGVEFRQKHPSCSILNCCAIKNKFEVCSDCIEYPCKRFDSEKNGYDSFVTHKKIFTNLNFIKEKGIQYFLSQQKLRIDVLSNLITNYDDGRTKSFYCNACALLPIDKLLELNNFANQLSKNIDLKIQTKLIKNELTRISKLLSIDLKLNPKHK